MITLGAALLGIGLVIVSVLGALSLAAGDHNTVAISIEIVWLTVGSIIAGLFFIGLGVWRNIRADKQDTTHLIREDWRRDTGV
jgi:NhaP-type Na+/H+ or K+/H+ antiporter